MCQPHSRVGPIPQEHLANTKWTLSLCVCVCVCNLGFAFGIFCIIDSLLFSLSALIFVFCCYYCSFFFKSEKGHEVQLVGRWKGSGRSWRGEHMIKMYCIIYNILYNILYIYLKGHLE